MRNLFVPTVAFVFMFLFSPSSFAQIASKTSVKPVGMTNQDVVDLTKAGFSEEFLIEQIGKASDKMFDLSAKGLIALKASGVSERIIKIMTGSTDQKNQVESKSEQSSDQSADKDPVPRRFASNVTGKVTDLFKKKSNGQESESKDDKTVEVGKIANSSLPPTDATYSLFIKAAETDGFADSELEDSVKDFKANAKPPRFHLADSEASADVLLTIIKREKRMGEAASKSGRIVKFLGDGRQVELHNIWANVSVKRNGQWMSGIKVSSNNCCTAWRESRNRVIDLTYDWLKQNAAK